MQNLRVGLQLEQGSPIFYKVLKKGWGTTQARKKVLGWQIRDMMVAPMGTGSLQELCFALRLVFMQPKLSSKPGIKTKHLV
ncbi:hypothetical protein XENTR_v10003574 [Xenopus tropicalis]|nr:hypothetical protein XENTR_v10003574 [Xenopus tropicalis]